MLRNRLPLPAGFVAALALLPFALTGCQSTGSPVAASGAYGKQVAQPPAGGWVEAFPTPADVKSVGEYQARGTTLELESFSALLLAPSPTANFAVDQPQTQLQPGRASAGVAMHELEVQETQPALKPNTNPDGTAFYQRADGAISMLGWVNQQFGDVRVTGQVNVLGGPGGNGAVSRQGVMARWDLGNNFYWFAIDFAGGTYEIDRARYFGVFAPLPGSTGPVQGFKNTTTYFLQFDLVGNTLEGKVFAPGPDGRPGQLVADTGKIVDPEPNLQGVSGFLAEPAIEQPYTPLEASFGTLTSAPLGSAPQPAKAAPRISGVPGAAQARFQRARALAQQEDAEGAVIQLNEALKEAPDYIEAQIELAWIRATNGDAKLRDPRQAVQLAEKAVGGIVELYDRRRLLPAAKPGEERFSKNFLIRAGLTLAAAYAATGRFESEPGPVVGEQLRNIATVAGVSSQQLRSAMADCLGMPAVETAVWAVTFAQQEAQRNQSPEARQLLATGQELLAAYRARRTVTGKFLP